jgi:hypothetical protein
MHTLTQRLQRYWRKKVYRLVPVLRTLYYGFRLKWIGSLGVGMRDFISMIRSPTSTLTSFGEVVTLALKLFLVARSIFNFVRAWKDSGFYGLLESFAVFLGWHDPNLFLFKILKTIIDRIFFVSVITPSNRGLTRCLTYGFVELETRYRIVYNSCRFRQAFFKI